MVIYTKENNQKVHLKSVDSLSFNRPNSGYIKLSVNDLIDKPYLPSSGIVCFYSEANNKPVFIIDSKDILYIDFAAIS